MSRIMIWQTAMLILAAGLSAWWWGVSAVGSAIWGGLSYLLPSAVALFALIVMKKIPDLLPIALLVAELGKIMLVCLIMLAVYLAYPAANWLAFLLGLILVSQAGLFTFRKRSVL